MLVFMAYLLEVVTPNGDWSERLVALVSRTITNGVSEVDMGFPKGWSEFEIWNA